MVNLPRHLPRIFLLVMVLLGGSSRGIVVCSYAPPLTRTNVGAAYYLRRSGPLSANNYVCTRLQNRGIRCHMSTTSRDRSTNTDKEQEEQQPPKNNNVKPPEILHHSNFLGDIYRIRIGDDDDFLAVNAVPTFASHHPQEDEGMEDGDVSSLLIDGTKTSTRKARGLEGALNHGPCFMVDKVLPRNVCDDLIETLEAMKFGSYKAGKNFHGALQVVVPPAVTDAVAQHLCRHIDVEEVEARRTEMLQYEGKDDTTTHDVRLVCAGLNRRWRVYRYAPGAEETFAPHIDAGFPPSGLTEDGTSLLWDATEELLGEEEDAEGDPDAAKTEIVSRLTVLMYLNDDFVGGETNFYQPASVTLETNAPASVIASVRPVAGSCLCFPQGVGSDGVEYARKYWPLHEGSPVVSGSRPKYVIRSDILFVTVKEPLPLESKLFRNDHLVRQAFLPRSSPLVDQNFLSNLSSLYNPHMGIENMGPLLYSFLRFTKKRSIVEIGAGYTSLWILQALKDNDDELKRVSELTARGQCRLLDTPWTDRGTVDSYLSTPASLLCIDNCEHQKETATGACAVAKSMGLDSYLEFSKGDAFELAKYLEDESIDVLWCDFGVGTRMQEFLSSGAWSSIRPGGFLLCHSTITNQRTRDWLEAARNHESEEITGMPPDQYVELSLLEPHKRFQNSVTVFQKRRSETKDYQEPIFSEYA